MSDTETNENAYMIMSNDFKERIAIKNNDISKLTKIIFLLYGLIRRGLEVEDNAFFEEARGVISEFFEEKYDI